MKMNCQQCEKCTIFWNLEFVYLAKELQLKILKQFFHDKDYFNSEDIFNRRCITEEEYRKLQNDIWESYKYQILMRDLKKKVELDKKLQLVKRFNESFTEEDVRRNSQKYLKALSDIERLFTQEFNKPAEAIKTPKWRLIIKDIFYNPKEEKS
jgi:hypothetical protein